VREQFEVSDWSLAVSPTDWPMRFAGCRVAFER